MNYIDPRDERFFPFLLPLLVGGAVGFPLGYAASNKNTVGCCGNQMNPIPYGYYPQYQPQYIPQYMPYQPYYPYVEYTNINIPPQR